MSRSSQERTAEAFAKLPNLESIVGVFVAQSGADATVNVGTTTVVAKVAGQYAYIPGDAVRLERRDGQLILLGPSAPRAAVGRISATGSPRCTVEYPSGSGVTAQMPFNSLYTPVVNDVVLIQWTEQGGVVVCKLSTSPTTVAPPTAPGGGLVRYKQTFTALDSGTFYVPGGSWKTNDVWSVGTGNNDGAWFYGTKVRDTIPDTAIIESATINLPVTAQQLGTANLQLHTSANKPGGNVTFTGSPFALPSKSGKVAIPTSLIDVMKVSAYGLGFDSDGHTIWRGTQADGSSGALEVTYLA